MTAAPLPRPRGRMRRAALVLAATAALTLAGTAGALSLSSTNFALSGSSFQGGDGNLANPTASQNPSNPAPYPTTRDWQAIAASPSLITIVDANTNDDAYGTGSHEERPEGWDLSTVA